MRNKKNADEGRDWVATLSNGGGCRECSAALESERCRGCDETRRNIYDKERVGIVHIRFSFIHNRKVVASTKKRVASTPFFLPASDISVWRETARVSSRRGGFLCLSFSVLRRVDRKRSAEKCTTTHSQHDHRINCFTTVSLCIQMCIHICVHMRI